MKQHILILLLTLAGLALMAQTNEPLPDGSKPLSNQLYLAPDSTVWTGDAFNEVFVRLGKYNEIKDLISLGVYSVAAIDDLQDFSGNQSVVVVRDTLRGGVFAHHSTGEADGGTVFPATGKGSGYWHRQYGEGSPVNILWYGADPTGNQSTSGILESIILDTTKAAIYIPFGKYSLDRPVGDIPFSGQGSMVISHDIRIYGEGELVANYPSAAGHVIGFEILGSDITFEDFSINGNDLANRGIYIRQINSDPDAPYSNFTARNVSIRNINVSSGYVQNRPNAINAFGKFDRILVENCVIENITSSSGNFTAEGIATGGNEQYSRMPKNIVIRGNTVRGIEITTSNANANAYGIRAAGDPDVVTIEYNTVTDIHTVQGRSVAGIIVGGEEIKPVRVSIRENYIKNIFKRGPVVTADQDAIYVSMASEVQAGDEVSCVLDGNTIINARGRAMKIQRLNTDVVNNNVFIEEDFAMPGGTGGIAVDFQYCDGLLEGNTFSFRNTDQNYYQRIVNFTERSEAIEGNRIIVKKNRVYTAGGTLSTFVRLFESAGELSTEAIIEDNYVNAAINVFVILNSTISTPTARYITANNNTIERANNWFINNVNGLNLVVSAANNVHKSGNVPISSYSNAVLTNNVGIVGNMAGEVAAGTFSLTSLNTPPSSPTDTGTAGEIRFTSDGIYLCIATDTWVKAEVITSF